MTICSNCKNENSNEEVFCIRCRRNLYLDTPYFLKFGDLGHPNDVDNMELLKGVEPLTSLVNSAVNIFQKSFSTKKLLKNAVLIGEDNFPQLYDLIYYCAEKLCLTYLPKVYILPSNTLNAFAIGGTNEPIIMINSILLKVMNEDELATVIGHEMGHIKGDHQQLHTMAYLLANGITFFSRLAPLALTLKLGLKSWLRYSELTADRAGLLIANDLELIKHVQQKISGDKKSHHGVTDFKGWREFIELWRTHPFTENRVKELEEFYNSDEYRRLLMKIALAKVMLCPYCQYRIHAETVFCPRCKKALK